MQAYGSKIHRAAGGAGKSGRKVRNGRTGGSCGRKHQDCDICHPGCKNGRARVRREAKSDLLIDILKEEQNG